MYISFIMCLLYVCAYAYACLCVCVCKRSLNVMGVLLSFMMLLWLLLDSIHIYLCVLGYSNYCWAQSSAAIASVTFTHRFSLNVKAAYFMSIIFFSYLIYETFSALGPSDGNSSLFFSLILLLQMTIGNDVIVIGYHFINKMFLKKNYEDATTQRA